ncbi:MAG: WXG100 family type VII secretion target [Segniliparus sp.]|uniref:WXG100 family type VII secretion target n=1 Tax=Segniliparus sp. TaxID=2804064 RepID=UPI003F319B5F
MDTAQRLVVDPEQLATAARSLDAAHRETGALLASTRESLASAVPSARGPAATALRALLEDWEAHEARHRADGERLSSGLEYAARTYEAADNLNAAQLRTGLDPLASAATPAGVAAAPPSAPTADPDPSDTVSTPYGELGEWMLQSNGQVANWLGQKHDGKPMYEPVNVVLVDRTSTTPQEAAERLNKDLAAAGFPAQTQHSTGYQGLIDGTRYSEQPTGSGQAYSDGFYLFPNDHGRVFGPAPAPGGGYVWTAAFSREQLGFNGSIIPTHVYDSFDTARDNLRDSLLEHGATDLGTIPMGNARNTATATTGDHDGNAIAIQLD